MSNPELQDKNISPKFESGMDPSEIKALAELTRYLSPEALSRPSTPTTGEIRDAIFASLKHQTNSPDLAKNIQVQSALMNIQVALYSEQSGKDSNPEEMLKNYAKLLPTLKGAIGANEASQAKGTENFQQNLAQTENQNSIANLDFAELGNKLRTAIDDAQRASADARKKVVDYAKLENNRDARIAQGEAQKRINEWPPGAV